MQAMRLHLRECILLQDIVWVAPCTGQISVAPLQHLMPWSHLAPPYHAVVVEPALNRTQVFYSMTARLLPFCHGEERIELD